MKHAKGRFCVGLWRAFFAYTENRSVPKERAACIHWMQFGKGLGSSQQAFLRGAGRTRCKKRDLVPGRTACWFLVPRIFALSGGISPNEKRGRLHILLLIIRIFQFDGSVNDTFYNGQILLRAKL